MTTQSTQEVTGLLQAWGRGDEDALAKLVPLVYRELRQAARNYMAGERPGHLLQTTALVNETYLRLVGVRKVSWQNRAHFLAICAQLMRRILVDYSRGHDAQKRGKGFEKISLEQAVIVSQGTAADVIAVDEALTRLAEFDPQQARLVELRFFGGLSIEEAAEVLGVSRTTVKRNWNLAKAWLARELRGGSPKHA